MYFPSLCWSRHRCPLAARRAQEFATATSKSLVPASAEATAAPTCAPAAAFEGGMEAANKAAVTADAADAATTSSFRSQEVEGYGNNYSRREYGTVRYE